jgi:cytochrome b561
MAASAGPAVTASTRQRARMRNTPTQYGALARFFHWAIAILVIVTIPIALTMLRVGEGPLQNLLFVVHESLGLSIFVLAILRVVWRFVEPPPPLPASVPAGRALIATVNHWLLYLLLFLMPVTGYLSVVAGGYPLNFFALFNVPRLVEKSESLGKFTESAHLALQYAVYVLVLIHVAAALHHHLVQRDGVLRRMWPGLRAASLD